jgi:hypothetical protein
MTCTAASDDATFPSTAFSRDIEGLILGVDTNPGATAPTDNYDIVINNADGIDIMGGALANRDTSTSERAIPLQDSYAYASHVNGALTVVISNNSTNSAIVVLSLHYIEG